MQRAYFSIAQAEAHLPVLATLTKRAQKLKYQLERYERMLVRQKVITTGEEENDFEFEGMYDADLTDLKEEFYHVVEVIETYGAVLREVDAGIIDFYTHFEGREVCLCWQVGERKIRHWHELDDGVSGRKRIFELK